MSVGVFTDDTSPVQIGSAASAYSNSHMDLGSPPTEGNILVMVQFHHGSSAAVYLPGWTTLHTAQAIPGGDDRTDILVRCVEAGESSVIPLQDVSGNVRNWYLSEWTPSGGGVDIVIGPTPTPGATTTHTVDPTVNDDETLGYTTPGMLWVNTTTGEVFVLIDPTDGAAVWVSTTATGAPTTADYLVGTAQAGLSAEIVVGPTPGGELGGTWASPTVDATHSGSAHLALGSTSSTAAAGNHAHAAGGAVGPLLLIDGHSVPPVFADILTNDDETDFLYGDP
jgi:hypothetical protein